MTHDKSTRGGKARASQGLQQLIDFGVVVSFYFSHVFNLYREMTKNQTPRYQCKRSLPCRFYGLLRLRMLSSFVEYATNSDLRLNCASANRFITLMQILQPLHL
jgi:hypothetical protein